MSWFLAFQLESSTSLNAVSQRFLHLMGREYLQEHQDPWQLAHMPDTTWLEEVVTTGGVSPQCKLKASGEQAHHGIS